MKACWKPLIVTVASVITLILVIFYAQPNSFSNAAPGGDTPKRIHRNIIRLVQVGDDQRSYILHIPESYDPSQATAVVLVFHGGGSNAYSISTTTHFSAQADRSGFVVVFPNGSGRPGHSVLSWNAGKCCGYALEQAANDMEFIRLLLDDLASLVNIDQQRIYATGMSNGAMMAYRLACELSDRIAAIAPVSGTQNVDRCLPEHPVSVVHIHGASDTYLPLEGKTRSESSTKTPIASVRNSIEAWTILNHCSSEAEVAITESILHERYAPCSQNSTVELYIVKEGRHSWPDKILLPDTSFESAQEINVTELIWRFFAAHPKQP